MCCAMQTLTLPLCFAIAGAFYSDVWRTELTEAQYDVKLTGHWMNANGMPIYVSHPKNQTGSTGQLGKSYPIVIVVHHAVGIYHQTFLREFSDALAKEGYVAFLPDLFWRAWSDDVKTGHKMP